MRKIEEEIIEDWKQPNFLLAFHSFKVTSIFQRYVNKHRENDSERKLKKKKYKKKTNGKRCKKSF